MRAYRRNRRPGNRGQTKAEEAYVTLVKTKGCLCCIALGYDHDEDGPMVEANHVLSGGIRIGHGSVIGLCQWHHRGRLLIEGWDHARHRDELGPSLAEGADPFHERWGSDQDLLQQQANLLAGIDLTPFIEPQGATA